MPSLVFWAAALLSTQLLNVCFSDDGEIFPGQRNEPRWDFLHPHPGVISSTVRENTVEICVEMCPPINLKGVLSEHRIGTLPVRSDKPTV